MAFDPQAVKKTISTSEGDFTYFSIQNIAAQGFTDPSRLPFSIKVLLESALRNYDDYQVTEKDIKTISEWSPQNKVSEIAFKPGRVILQDFTGVPCVVDLAALRSAMSRMGGDIKKINPQVQCDLVIDHSVQVDEYGSEAALRLNVEKEFYRNKERYEFLKWGQSAFQNFRVVPPATGIVHQVNLEYLAEGVLRRDINGDRVAFPDSLVGTDSHTTMINGLGIVGWGVGGIEAEAVMLGEPIYMLIPDVIGFELKGQLSEGVTATDMVLTVTQMLRAKGVVGKFVEFFGDGLAHLTLPDRATISNMAPEYGATTGIFPIDEETLNYYRITNRSDAQVDLVEKYMKAQGMFYDASQPAPEYTDKLELDLSSVEPCLAGPKRPQDRINLSDMKSTFEQDLTKPLSERGFGLKDTELDKTVEVKNGNVSTMTHGSVVIAAITSCTNTSNPSVLIGAGLLARKAIEKGLTVKPFVKTSLAPGSQVVQEYLSSSGLLKDLEGLGFHIVGYGCTTCIGNSGPLPEAVAKAVESSDIVAASVLSGNRNFEGRVNPLSKANYLASPPLVVAYAIAGSVDVDLVKDPIGQDKDGQDVYLKDIWPSRQEIRDVITSSVNSQVFAKRYGNVEHGNEEWNGIESVTSDLYEWKDDSTYIQEPPFFVDLMEKPESIKDVKGARCLVKVGDSITTDHISPAGAIAKDSPAGAYLQEKGVDIKDFNSYGSRRGNDRVMTRGTFANIRLRNQMAPGTEGSWTVHLPDGDKMSIFDASLKYKEEGVPLVVLAGKEYGTGSSRDWAAKGTSLLGVKAVLAESYERIHRSNLVGMGVLPLQYKDGESSDSHGLKGDEIFDITGLKNNMTPGCDVTVKVHSTDGSSKEITMTARLDTPVDVDYYRNGGILQTVLRKLAKSS